MKKNIFFSKVRTVISSVCFVVLATSCSNPAGSDDEEEHDEHEEPFGVALIMNGLEIAYQENGTVQYESGEHIDIPAGGETDLINIRWIAEDGDRFEAHADEGYSLQWSVENENMLEVEQHDEDGPWQFHLVGVNTGNSEIQFSLFHNDHSDFTSLPFIVEVHE